jgi:hypothetical protein
MKLQAAQAGLDPLRLVEIVRVENPDEIGVRREADGAVQGVVRAGVRLGEERDARVCRSGGAGGLEGAVARAVIDDDDAIRRAGLRQHAAERIADIGRVIVKRDDDGNAHTWCDGGNGGAVSRRRGLKNRVDVPANEIHSH